MCHGHSAWSMELAREERDPETEEREPEADEREEWSPEFANEDGEEDVEVLADGGEA